MIDREIPGEGESMHRGDRVQPTGGAIDRKTFFDWKVTPGFLFVALGAALGIYADYIHQTDAVDGLKHRVEAVEVAQKEISTAVNGQSEKLARIDERTQNDSETLRRIFDTLQERRSK